MQENNEPNVKFEMRMPEGYNNIHHRHLGPILAVLIILLIIIFGGLYLWGGMLFKDAAVPPTAIVNNAPETPRAAADAQILDTLSPSDELDAIEADLGSTNLDSFDVDLTTIDAELDAALR